MRVKNTTETSVAFIYELSKRQLELAEKKQMERANPKSIANAIYDVGNEVLQKDEELAQRYLGQLEPVFLNLAEFYKKKDTMQVGYFSYFLTKHIRTEYMLTDSLREVLLEYIRKDNLYCRVSELEALYAIRKSLPI